MKYTFPAAIALLILAGCAVQTSEGFASMNVSLPSSSARIDPDMSGTWKDYAALTYSFSLPEKWKAVDVKQSGDFEYAVSFMSGQKNVARLRCPRSEDGFAGYDEDVRARVRRDLGPAFYEATLHTMRPMTHPGYPKNHLPFYVLEVGKQSTFDGTCQLLSAGNANPDVWNKILQEISSNLK